MPSFHVAWHLCNCTPTITDSDRKISKSQCLAGRLPSSNRQLTDHVISLYSCEVGEVAGLLNGHYKGIS